jgi:transcription termination factor rho
LKKNQNRKLFFYKFAVLNNNDENTLYYREDENTLQRMRIVRKYLSDMNIMEAVGLIQDRMKKTKDYEEFLMSMNE